MKGSILLGAYIVHIKFILYNEVNNMGECTFFVFVVFNKYFDNFYDF